MARLRGPGGCPWDLAQDHASLTRFLVEETYEVLQAIAENDDKSLCEELGDVLLQVVFHARIAEERHAFELCDVITGLADKLFDRHPHVFGEGERLASAGEVEQSWNQRKRSARRSSLLDGIPPALPALIRAWRLGERVTSVHTVLKRTELAPRAATSLRRLAEAIEHGRPEELEAGLGPALFVLANVAGALGIDTEQALQTESTLYSDQFRSWEQTGSKKPDTASEQLLADIHLRTTREIPT
ncbi:MAG: hypothetical protein A2284_14695 [Deltaproteobacteria bacterium RIFOXYA12_FULL_61_11]|nr:MAG: hypothetical protein A2284_14695 [Deltaproteobacteria bacterium RIFOXYA12_FULL_61_11]